MNRDYLRFRNSLQALQACNEFLFDNDLSEEENRARAELIELCREILDATDEPDDPLAGFED